MKPQQARFRDRLLTTWTGFAATGRTNWPTFRGTGTDGCVQTLTSDDWNRADFTRDHNQLFWKRHG
ncbi:hypothetical protein ACFWZ2_25085 [Streptomyces sp. NPDC059002]|uniref:hypothetical protein n=1 Tax=Streptomyces sp. NPDC059002 TaxID=3346690 RepID=UPI0036A6C5F2